MNRSIRLALVAACTLLAVSAAQAQPTTRPIEVPMLVAHRGASADAPENTLAAVRLGLEQGAEAIEIDLHVTRDGQLIVIHDKETKRTADGANVVVAEASFDDLRARDAGAWKDAKFAGERLPTPAEVMALIPPGRKVLLEVKCGPEAIPELARQVRASGLAPEQAIVISFNADALAAAKRAMPEHPAFFLYSFKRDEKTGAFTESVEGLIARAKAMNADGLDLGMNRKTLDVFVPEFVAKVRAAGLSLHVWTVDDVEIARRAIELGVDSITTNRPAALRAELKQTATTRPIAAAAR